jgi:hypothetical protein
MKIAFVPIDNRPVCYNLAKDIVSIDKSIEFFIPPREFLGGLTHSANINALFNWLKNLPTCDSIILSLDTLAYGGLIPSRRSSDTFEDIKTRITILKQILETKKSKIYAFSSIMRISNNNYKEEEKEYWSEYGKKIFKYSFSDGKENEGIPQEILEDYIQTRARNFEINKLYLEWEKEGFFEKLIFSKDDCAPKGFNVKEANFLDSMGGTTKTGADEIPLSLLARAIENEIKIFVQFIEPQYQDRISNYEDISIHDSVNGQLELCGFNRVFTPQEADIILIVNNFIEKQGELVMGWDTKPFEGDLILPNKPYAIADVRFANGGDNNFVAQLLSKLDLKNFCGYSGWNTSANTLGSLLAELKVKLNAEKYSEIPFKKLELIRFLDDWAYQANVRSKISQPTDISKLMSPYETILCEKLQFNPNSITYQYPWNRKFEIEVSIN